LGSPGAGSRAVQLPGEVTLWVGIRVKSGHLMARLDQKDKLRILLVDDYPLVREALRTLLSREADLVVCGEAEDQKGALAAIAASKPDLVIADLMLKDAQGLELITAIRRRHPGTRVLVLSICDEMLYAEKAIRAGACGYVSKYEASSRLMDAVRKVLRGEVYWSERVALKIASRVAGGARALERSSPVDRLSERELEVFELIGKGLSTEQIAALMRISSSSVETYRTRIRRKMGFNRGGELLPAAIGWNMARLGFRTGPPGPQ